MSTAATEGPDESVYSTAAERRAIDFDQLTKGLGETFGRRLDATDVTITDLRTPEKAGTSSGTILFSATWSDDRGENRRDLVVRTHPDKVQLYREPNFRQQYDVIDTLHRSGRVRVPETLFYEDDPTVLGVPFFVMEQLHGHVPVTFPGYNVSGFLFDATPEQRRVTWTTAVEELCRIAQVPVDDMQFLDKPELGPTGLEQQLEYWRRSVDWCTGDQTPDEVWHIYEWLATNLPSDRKNGFAWGDARIGNMMFGDDFRLVGVMDWEAANLSGPRQDLAWWVFFDDFNSEARGVRPLDGLGSRDETIALWEDRVGERAGDIYWYEVFTGFQICLFTFRTTLVLGGVADLETNQGYRMTRERLGW
jgi:aminoglycoside phosphotransferase (APT) family kinase protein